MRYILLFCFAFLMTSCLVVKVYPTERTATEGQKPKTVERKMIPSGSYITLNNATSEILFFGEDEVQLEGTILPDSLNKTALILHQDLSKVVASNDTTARVRITTKPEPWIVVNGKPYESKKGLNGISPSTIDSISVLKGPAALKKYGDKGKNGVIEITLKKN